MLQGEHSAILLTFIKLPFVIKIFVLSIFEWLFSTGLTVHDLIGGFVYVTGLDIAYISNGYVYHTRNDKAKFIEPGCIQRGGKYRLTSICEHNTIKHLIFAASKFGGFQILTYWRCLILAVSRFKALQNYFLSK